MKTDIREYESKIKAIVEELQQPGISYFIVTSRPKGVEIKQEGILKEVQLCQAYAIHPNTNSEDKIKFLVALANTLNHLSQELNESDNE